MEALYCVQTLDDFVDREYPFPGTRILSVNKVELGEHRVPETVRSRRHGSDLTGGGGGFIFFPDRKILF